MFQEQSRRSNINLLLGRLGKYSRSDKCQKSLLTRNDNEMDTEGRVKEKEKEKERRKRHWKYMTQENHTNLRYVWE